MTGKILIGIVLTLVVESTITERGVDDIRTHAICKLHGRRPIVLLHEVLAVIVLTAEHPIRGFGSCTHYHVRLVGSHAGEHFHTVIVLFVDIRIGVHKISRTQ